MRRLTGAALILLAAAAAAVGGFWAFMKAAGAEVDWCGAGADGCTSGWYPAAAILVSALFVGALGAAVLRGGRRD